MLSRIAQELKEHVPFTLFGAVTGILLMAAIVWAKVNPHALEPVFEGSHALHVFLSAVVTSAMYRRYRPGLAACAAIGFIGAVASGTLSDVVFPHLGGLVVGGEMRLHVPFIEEWWLINPIAAAGVAFGIYRPRTKVPHSGHVLLSTWASLFYLTAYGQAPWLRLLPQVFVVLFVAVWMPCCFSDIVFPLLFVRDQHPPEAAHSHQ